MTENTTSASAGIRKIARADHERVIDLMARAFDDDPVMNYLAWQDERRSQRVRRLMSVGLQRLTFPFGETYVTEGFEGAAWWNPPNGRPHGLLSDLALLPSMIGVATVRGLARALGALDTMEKRHPKEPHYYLLAIGVDPDMQGRGVGSQLMAPMLMRCDAERMPAYLESSKERNVPLYERHGFRIVEEMRLGRTGPPVWRMWRDPQV